MDTIETIKTLFKALALHDQQHLIHWCITETQASIDKFTEKLRPTTTIYTTSFNTQEDFIKSLQEQNFSEERILQIIEELNNNKNKS